MLYNSEVSGSRMVQKSLPTVMVNCSFNQRVPLVLLNVSMNSMCLQVPLKARRRFQILTNWSCRLFVSCLIEMPRTEPWSSARATSALHHCFLSLISLKMFMHTYMCGDGDCICECEDHRTTLCAVDQAWSTLLSETGFSHWPGVL